MTSTGHASSDNDCRLRGIPLQISIGEGMDIGENVGSAVDFTYKPPFRFTGKIDKVTVDLGVPGGSRVVRKQGQRHKWRLVADCELLRGLQ
jgi:hypothetical protein